MKPSSGSLSFSPAMKMADLMDAHLSLLGVFVRMGLRFGYGDATVEEVCRQAGLDAETFLLICRVYAQEGYRPGADALQKADIQAVAAYLRQSHSYYLEGVLGRVEDSLRATVAACDERSRAVIRRFFSDLVEELSRHFEYEEQHVFPLVETGASASFRAAEFEDTHQSVAEKLADLKNLILKYLPAQGNQAEALRTVQLLSIMDSDVQKHIILEDCVLAPMLAPRERTVLAGGLAPESARGEVLSQREQEILVCVAKGMLNKEIADHFQLSVYTVISHRKNITRKTGIKTVAGLTVYALLNNLIDMNSVE